MSNTATQNGTAIASPSGLWPLSTLRTRLAKRIYDAPTAAQYTECDEILNDGYLALCGDHDWTFLRGTASVSLTSALNGVADLPSDFDTMFPGEDPIITAYQGWPRMERRPLEWVLSQIQASGTTTAQYPRCYDIRLKTFSAGTGPRHEIVVYPYPSADVTVTFPYRVRIDLLANDSDYPRCGQALQQALIMRSLVVWEERTGKTDGVYHRLWFGSGNNRGDLARAIERDNNNRAPIRGTYGPDAQTADRTDTATLNANT